MGAVPFYDLAEIKPCIVSAGKKKKKKMTSRSSADIDE